MIQGNHQNEGKRKKAETQDRVLLQKITKSGEKAAMMPFCIGVPVAILEQQQQNQLLIYILD